MFGEASKRSPGRQASKEKQVPSIDVLASYTVFVPHAGITVFFTKRELDTILPGTYKVIRGKRQFFPLSSYLFWMYAAGETSGKKEEFLYRRRTGKALWHFPSGKKASPFQVIRLISHLVEEGRERN